MECMEKTAREIFEPIGTEFLARLLSTMASFSGKNKEPLGTINEPKIPSPVVHVKARNSVPAGSRPQ